MLLTALVCGMLGLLGSSTPGQDRVAVAPLEAMATITGQVVDDKGEPLDHVFVVSLPVLKGTFTHAQTDETGRFTLSVAKDGFYQVTLETEDMDLDDKENLPELMRPGDGEVKLVVRRPNRMTFVVVDDATGSPIERYGLGIANKPNQGISGGIDQQDIPLRPHARGEAVAHADPARHVVRVQAPGYASIESEITPEGDARTRETLRLRKGGSLLGKVAAQSGPLPHATVAVVRGPVGTVYSPTDRYEADSWFLLDYRKDLGDYVGRPRFVDSAADGSFRFEDLSAGTYDLLVEAPGLGPAILKRIKVEHGEARDVGVLTLGAPATIRGKVTTGPGASPVGMQYSVDGEFQQRQKITNADGTFTIEGLGAGLHQLTLLPSASLPNEDAREIRLGSGETREIVFDLSGSAPCAVEVWAMRAGKVADVERVWALVTIEARAPGREPWKVTKSESLLRTKDSQGFTHSVPGGHEVSFVAYAENGLRVGRSPVETLPSGGRREIQIALDTGSLEIELPGSVEPPEYGYLELSLRRGDEQSQEFTAFTSRSNRNSKARIWSSHRCEVGEIESGPYRIEVRAYSTSGDAEGKEDPRYRRTLIFVSSAEVDVKSGEKTIVRFP